MDKAQNQIAAATIQQPNAGTKRANPSTGGIGVCGEYNDGPYAGITLYLGKRGSGKSSDMAANIRRTRRCTVFDSVSQYQPGQLGRCTLVHQPGELKEYYRKALNAPTFRVLYQPIGNIQEHFDAVCQLVIACGSQIFAVDEIDRYCSASHLPAHLDFLVNCGRHCRVSVVGTSRRPAQIARELSSQAREFRIWRMTEPRDLAYLAEYIGQQGAAQLPTLRQFTYLRYVDGTDGYTVHKSEI